MGNSVDQVVGRQIRYLRLKNAKTIEDLARDVSLDPAQVARFESGEERVGAQHLWRIANVFRVPIKTFFPLPDDTCPEELAVVQSLADVLVRRAVHNPVKQDVQKTPDRMTNAKKS